MLPRRSSVKSDDMAIHLCGASWVYCDANCNECCNNKFIYTTTTEVLDEEH